MLKAIRNLFALPAIWFFLVILSLILYLLSHLPRFLSGRYYHWLSRLWCRTFVRALDVKLQLVHQNTKALPEQYILIANHPSALEDFAIPALFDVYPLAKAGVRDWLVLGRISDYAGTIYVSRDSSSSRHAAKQALADAVKAGKNIVIFPEGGCKGRRIYETFQAGAFDISLQTGIPVLPVFLHYIDEDTFEWKSESLIKKLWQIFSTNNNQVDYYVHDAISPADFTDRLDYAEHARLLFLEWQEQYVLQPNTKSIGKRA